MGPDAAKFTQFLICRDLRTCEIGQCKYVLITDQDGGIINDPILLKLAEDRFWLSIADSDVLLWAKGVAATVGMDVKISEPDVSPLQLQGPLSREILRAAFSDETAALKYYRFINYDWNGVPLKISRTGWSSELGYEIFLCDGSKGDLLWEYLMKVGKPMGLHPGYTSSIRRIEGAMLSCQADMTLVNNPFEMGMDRFVDLDTNADFLSKTALRKIKSRGPKQVHVGVSRLSIMYFLQIVSMLMPSQFLMGMHIRESRSPSERRSLLRLSKDLFMLSLDHLTNPSLVTFIGKYSLTHPAALPNSVTKFLNVML